MYVVESLIIGLVAGVFSSLLIFVLFYNWRPKVIVSNILAIKDNTIRVKILNKTKYDLHDVSYELIKCHKRGDGTIDIKMCKPSKDAIRIISKYDKKDKEATYAYRISYFDDINEITKWLSERDNYLLFNITAKHSFSGGIKIVSKKYYKTDIREGIFEKNLGMDVLNIL